MIQLCVACATTTTTVNSMDMIRGIFILNVSDGYGEGQEESRVNVRTQSAASSQKPVSFYLISKQDYVAAAADCSEGGVVSSPAFSVTSVQPDEVPSHN